MNILDNNNNPQEPLHIYINKTNNDKYLRDIPNAL